MLWPVSMRFLRFESNNFNEFFFSSVSSSTLVSTSTIYSVHNVKIIAKLSQKAQFYLVVSGWEKDRQRRGRGGLLKTQATGKWIAVVICLLPWIFMYLCWWRMKDLSKNHEPLHQLGWSAADWATNMAFEMAALLASLNLHSDLMASSGSQRRLWYHLNW